MNVRPLVAPGVSITSSASANCPMTSDAACLDNSDAASTRIGIEVYQNPLVLLDHASALAPEAQDNSMQGTILLFYGMMVARTDI